MRRSGLPKHTSFLPDRRIVSVYCQGGRAIETVLSYCSARMLLKGLLPMIAMSPRQSRCAVNDNDPSAQRGVHP
jgi:hypothetical protein